MGKKRRGLHTIIQGAWRPYIEYGFVVEMKGVQTASLLVMSLLSLHSSLCTLATENGQPRYSNG